MLKPLHRRQSVEISPEAPVPVVRFEREHLHLGGAANVAHNLAALGARVSLVGIVGADEAARRVTTALGAAHVSSLGLVRAADRPTTEKSAWSRIGTSGREDRLRRRRRCGNGHRAQAGRSHRKSRQRCERAAGVGLSEGCDRSGVMARSGNQDVSRRAAPRRSRSRTSITTPARRWLHPTITRRKWPPDAASDRMKKRGVRRQNPNARGCESVLITEASTGWVLRQRRGARFRPSRGKCRM